MFSAVLVSVGQCPDVAVLRERGIEVRIFDRQPSLTELANAALEIRKLHPRLPLLVAGPPKLVRQLERRYPALIDAPLPSSAPPEVMEALTRLGPSGLTRISAAETTE